MDMQPTQPGPYVYTKDPGSLYKLLKVMLWISLVVGIAALVSDIQQIQLLTHFFTQSEAEANDRRQLIIGIIFGAVYLVTGIVYFMWVYRANINSRGFGAEGMEFTPGWSVGYYFVPLLNLWRPFQAIKEVWLVAMNPRDWKNQKSSILLAWWWAFWIISAIVANVSLRMLMSAKSLPALIDATNIAIFSDVLSLITAMFVFLLVKKITEMQERLVAAV